MGISIADNNFQKEFLKPKGFRKYSGSLLLSTLAINILSLALPVMTLQIYDRVLPNTGSGTLPVLVAGVCLAIFFETCLRLCRAYVIGRSGASYEHLMATRAIEKILNANLSQMDSCGIGEYLHRISSIGKLKDFFNGFTLTVFLELLFVPVFLGLIYYVGDVLVVVPLSILAVFIVFSMINGFHLRQALHDREKADDKRFNFLIESLEGVHTLKSFALEKFFERRYEALEEKSTLTNYVVTQNTANIFNVGSIFSHFMVIAVITAGAVLVLQGNLTTGGLIASLLLSGRLMQPVQKGLALWTKYQDFALAKKHIHDLLSTPQKSVTNPEIDPVADGRLVVSDMSFHFKNENNDLLKNINLKIGRGDTVLISGAHGCGKTTLLKVMSGIYPATDGEVFINGENISDYPPEKLSKYIGYIGETPLVFRGTIRNNITCFGQIDEASAKEIASMLRVDEDVAKLPSGFDTYLNGNNTDIIPPGLKQRISIVRTLATKPRIILFDNADRTLDKEGYAMMYSLLARLRDKTCMVLVTNDHNICGLAQQHYRLEKGDLVRESDPSNTGNVRPYKELCL